jgi:hypothetical protein
VSKKKAQMAGNDPSVTIWAFSFDPKVNIIGSSPN